MPPARDAAAIIEKPRSGLIPRTIGWMSGPPTVDDALGESRWDREALRDPHARRDKAARVEAMFDAIAPTYERVNTIATFGRDAAWRTKLVTRAAVHPTDTVLDIACGTGDVIRTFARSQPAPARIIGLDFSAGMLAGGRYDGIRTPIQLIRADALQLPLADGSVDVVSCAFGVRNFQNLQRGLSEMARVLRPGGRIVILEFTTPRNPILAIGYRLYCGWVLPTLGRIISRDHDKTNAYKYLPRSIQTFETTHSMCGRLRDAGFEQVAFETMNLGGVALYRGIRG